MHKSWLTVLGAGMLCLTCGPTTNRWAPTVLRPNTLALRWVSATPDVMQPIIDSLRVALPNERAMCLVGYIQLRLSDSVYGVVITGSYPAVEKGADSMHVYFYDFDGGCDARDGKTVAIAHSHPNPNYLCDASDDDAELLFYAKGAAFEVMICADGNGQVLWQDGRRDEFSWVAKGGP